jgi:hypothetical protein
MRYIYRPNHPKASANGFVSEMDLGSYEQPKLATNATVMVGRFYENTKAPDGTDIGSRKRHRQYMKERGLTTADDFAQSWANAEKERLRVRQEGRMPQSKERREALERAVYKIAKP